MTKHLKRVVAASMAVVALSIAAYGNDIVDYFSRAPMECVSFLPQYGRLDMVDYFRGGSKVPTETKLGNRQAIVSLDSAQIVYAGDDSVTTAIAMLPGVKGDTLLMVIRTVPVPVKDSTIDFYDKNWRELVRRPMAQPVLTDWLKPADRKQARSFDGSIPFILSTADYDPSSQRLTLTNRTDSFFTKTDRPAGLSMLVDKIVYVWNGRKFIKEPAE